MCCWLVPSVCLLSPPLLSSRSVRPTALRQLRTAAWVGRSRLVLACMPSETIGTDKGGVAGLRFHDQSNLDVGPNSSVRLNKFIYDPNRSGGKAVLDAAKGSFRFSTGAQGGNRNYSDQDPVWDARHSRLKPAPHCVSRHPMETTELIITRAATRSPLFGSRPTTPRHGSRSPGFGLFFAALPRPEIAADRRLRARQGKGPPAMLAPAPAGFSPRKPGPTCRF